MFKFICRPNICCQVGSTDSLDREWTQHRVPGGGDRSVHVGVDRRDRNSRQGAGLPASVGEPHQVQCCLH